jgi:outer membrane protein OmpA-like peptidoglycan-associated protein
MLTTNLLKTKLMFSILPVSLMIGCAGTGQEKIADSESEQMSPAVIEQPMDNVGTVAFLEDLDSGAIDPIVEESTVGTGPTIAFEQSGIDFSGAPQTNPDLSGSMSENEISQAETVQPMESTSSIGDEVSTNHKSDGEVITAGANSQFAIDSDNPGVVQEVTANGTEQQVANEDIAQEESTSKNEPDQLVFHFDFDAATLSEADKKELEKHAEYLLANPDTVLNIFGHTDNRGSRLYNRGLSERRANAVADLLASYGVPKGQIEIIAYGEESPVSDLNNWYENRRVELKYINNFMVTAR